MCELVWKQEQVSDTTWKISVDAGDDIHLEAEIDIPEAVLAVVPEDQRERFVEANLLPVRTDMEEEVQRRLAA